MKQFILYGTVGCHLCEDAEALLAPLLNEQCEIECIDISDDDQLLDRYGELIPVLRRVGDGAELNWPFASEKTRDFLFE
ncbi:MAG: hypothetical protein JWM78_511 [Verrucomicrobiaceae bacterium]|nr:hypothetical protein [Verrucomicrobiaceae bacterium]